MSLRLDFQNALAFRRLTQENLNAARSAPNFTQQTLSGCLELFLTAELDSVAHEIVKASNLSRIWAKIEHAKADMLPVAVRSLAASDSPEFLALRSPDLKDRESVRALQYSEFRQQFSKSAQSAGFTSQYSRALCAVLGEMCENVFQHSRIQEKQEFAMAAFHAASGTASFSVIDAGIGILASLRESEEWSELGGEHEALIAIVEKKASRKPSLGEGEGFKQLFKSLLDRNSIIRIRSGSSMVTLQQEAGARVARYASTPKIKGVHVAFQCSKVGNPEESAFFT